MRLPTREYVVNELEGGCVMSPGRRRKPPRSARHALNGICPGGATGLKRAAGGCHDVLHDGEAEARPTRSARAITSVEALEETRQIIGSPHRRRRWLVRDPTSPSSLPDRQGEGRSGTGIAKRVLRQVLDNHPKHSRSQRDRRSRLGVKGERDAGSTAVARNSSATSSSTGPDRADRGDSRAPGLELAQEEDVVDQLRHVLDSPSALLE